MCLHIYFQENGMTQRGNIEKKIRVQRSTQNSKNIRSTFNWKGSGINWERNRISKVFT